MTVASLLALRDLVLADGTARERLLAVTGDDEFVAAALALAADHDLHLAEADLRAALVEGDRRRIERWL